MDVREKLIIADTGSKLLKLALIWLLFLGALKLLVLGIMVYSKYQCYYNKIGCDSVPRYEDFQ